MKEKKVNPKGKKKLTVDDTKNAELKQLSWTFEDDTDRTIAIPIKEINKKIGNSQNINVKDKPRKFKINKTLCTFLLESIYIVLIEVIFKLIHGNLAFDNSILRIIIGATILGFILSIGTNNLKTVVRKTVLILVNFIIAFYAWLQTGFQNFLGAFISIGSAEQGTKVTDYLWDFLSSYNPVMYVFYIPFILMLLYYIFEKRILKSNYEKKLDFKNLKLSTSISLIFLTLIASYYASISLSFMQDKYQTITNKTLFKNPSNPAIAIKNFGTTTYFLLDIKSTAFGGVENVYAAKLEEEIEKPITRDIDDTAWKKLISEEKNTTLNTLNNYFIRRNIAEKNESTGIFEGKNLIYIMLESISQAVFEDEYKDYFPTLHRLYKEGITGVNNYSPKNNCATGESEMTSQISLYSIETTCTVNTYKDNIYPEAIMSMFNKNGYYTSAYHNYTEKYYTRSKIELNLGSEKYYGVKELGIPYKSEYKEWPSDLLLMEKALPKFIDKEKFASYIVTVNAHTPYNQSSEIGDKHLELFKDLDLPKAVKRYLSKVKETDLAIEYLLKTLEDFGILDDTVIVLFGDHYPYGLKGDYELLAPYDININQEIDRTPFIIYNSETKGTEITKITTPLDYTPTLLNLFGIDYDPRHYAGNDVFSASRGIALFPDNSWLVEEGFYDASKADFIPVDSGTVLSDEEIIEINQEMNDLRNMSNLAIKNNYFEYLYDYFEQYEKNEIENSSEKEEE